MTQWDILAIFIGGMCYGALVAHLLHAIREARKATRDMVVEELVESSVGALDEEDDDD